MGLWDSITSLPQEIAEAFLSVLSNLLLAFVTPLLEIARVLMTANINPFTFEAYWQIIVTIISLFYLLLFLIVGLKFLFGSYDPVQRKEAKEWFKKTVLLVIAVNASLLFYSLVLNISSAVALVLWSEEFETMFAIESLGALDFLWLLLFASTLFLALSTLVIRHMFLIMGAMVFPIGLFLYFIPPVKEYGSAILHLTVIVAFMNVMDIIILIGIQLFAAEFSFLPSITMLSLTMGFLLIFLANIALALIAIKKALNTIGVNVSVTNIVKSVGGIALA